MVEQKGVMGEPAGDIATEMYAFLGVTPECEVSGDREFLKEWFSKHCGSFACARKRRSTT